MIFKAWIKYILISMNFYLVQSMTTNNTEVQFKIYIYQSRT